MAYSLFPTLITMHVAIVFSSSAYSKVFFAVIQGVTVNVINDISLWRIHNCSVKILEFPLSVFFIGPCSHVCAVRCFVSIPLIMLKLLIIVWIN